VTGGDNRRLSQRERAAARKIERQQEMDRAIVEGRLTVRAMTAEERKESDARLAAASRARKTGPKTRRLR
jgi:hypothetical protein